MRGSMREKRPGVWELRVYVGIDPGSGRERRISRTVHGGRRQAEDELAALVVQVGQDRPTTGEVGTVAELADQWLAHIEPDLEVLTVQQYRRLVAKSVVPELGRLRVDRVTARDIDLFLAKLRAQGLSASSIRHRRAVLSGMFKLAVRWGLAARNPVRDATTPPAPKSKAQAVDPEVLPKLLAVAMELDEELALAVRAAAVTGARRGELCGLQWGDLEGDRVTIRRAVIEPKGGGAVVKDTKTHAVRTVSLDRETMQLLAEYRQVVERRAEVLGVALGEWVWSLDPAGRKPLRPDNLSKFWTKVRAAAGVPDEVGLHGLRHLSASWLLAQGVPVATVSARLGHATPATTWNFYAHALPGDDGGAADALGGLLAR